MKLNKEDKNVEVGSSALLNAKVFWRKSHGNCRGETKTGEKKLTAVTDPKKYFPLASHITHCAHLPHLFTKVIVCMKTT